jgi:hypothetical protein
MPTVPTYGGQKVQQQGLGTPYLPESAAPRDTGAVARGLGQATDAISRIAMTERDRADEATARANAAMVDEATNGLYQFEQTRIFDAKAGLLAQRGKNAIGAAQSVYADYDKQVSEIAAGLANEYQRQAFNQRATRFRMEMARRVESHVAGETVAYEKAMTTAQIENSAAAAIANYDDPDRVRLELSNQTAAIVKSLEGQDPAVVKAAVEKASGVTHVGIIERMIANGKDEQAKAYFDANKGLIPGDKLADMEAKIEQVGALGRGQRIADGLMALTASESDAVNRVRQDVSDPKVRDIAITEIKQRWAEKRRVEADQNQELFNSAWRQLENAGGQVDRIQRAGWTQLAPDQQEALERRAEQLRERKEPVMDDATWARYDAIRMQAINPETQAEFLRRDLLLERHNLPAAEFRQLYDMQQSMRQQAVNGRGGEKAEKLLAGIRTSDQVANDALAAVGLDPAVKLDDDEDQYKQVLLFRRSLDNEVAQFQLSEGREASPLEVQAIADRLLIKNRIKETFLGLDFLNPDTEKFAFEVEPSDVPAKDRAEIVKALRSKGRPVNESNILVVYRLKLSQNAQ